MFPAHLDKLALMVLVLASSASALRGEIRAQAMEWFGRVVAQSDLEGIPGVRISIEPIPEGGLMADISPLDGRAAGAPETTTSADGGFAIDAPTGRRLRLSAPGFLDGFVLLHEDRPNDLGRLVLRHEMSFAGRVLVEGRPAARVTVLVPAEHGHGAKSTTSRATISDEDGEFHLGGLRPEQTQEILFVRDGLAHSVDLGHALFPFDPRHYEVGDIELSPVVRLAGTLLTRDGGAVDDAIVWVSSSSTLRLPRSTTDNDAEPALARPQSAVDDAGRFALAVPAGRHVVTAFSPAHGRTFLEILAPAPAGNDVELRLPGTVSRRARVLDPSGSPIAGAVVHVRSVAGWPSSTNDPAFDGDHFRFTTDGEGCFEARGLALDDTVWLEVESPGYVARRFRIETAAASSPSTGCDDIDPVRLERSGSVSGRVVTADDRPVVGAQVSAHRAQDVGGYMTPGRAPSITDDNGRFTLDNLGFGDYTVYARAPGYEHAMVENLAVGPLDPESEPQAAVTREIRLIARSIPDPVPLEVLVLDPRGAPEPEAEVRASLNTGGMASSAPSPGPHFTGADGRLPLATVSSGLYSISASADGRRNGSAWQGPYRADDARTLAIIEMRPVPPPVSLAGRFVDADGNGIPRAIIHADGSARWRDTARALTEADGTFRFDSLAAARYVLKAEASDGIEVIHRALLDVGQPPSGVIIQVPRLGAITGSVENARPGELDELWVTASTGEYYEAVAGQGTSVRVNAEPDGSFHLESLIPGEWYVSARASNGREASITTSVVEGESTTGVIIPFAAGLRLSGRLLWRDDTNQRAGVRISGYSTREGRGFQVGPEGTFEALDLPADLYDIMIGGGGLRAPFFVSIDVRADTEIEIPMRGASVSGIVVDAESGAPIPGVGIRTDPIPQRTADMHDQFRDSDRNGRFEAGPFPSGPWSFEFTAPGYGHRAPVIEIGDTDIDEYIVALDPTPGLRLIFNTPNDIKPSIISISWRDLELGEGFQSSVFPESRDTLEFLLPRGRLARGILQASNNEERLAARAIITNRGDPITIDLALAGRLRVTLPPANEPTANRPVARIYDADGFPVTNGDGGLDRGLNRRREGDYYLISTMPPGTYRIEVRTHDGRDLIEIFEIYPGQDTELALR
jgi:protocatechuate 3,4-dioxygenase beta subunit